jgi:hypothetical protein
VGPLAFVQACVRVYAGVCPSRTGGRAPVGEEPTNYQSGAVIPGAILELTDLNKGTKSTAVSNSSGYYSFRQIPYGSYTLTARTKGFGDTRVSPVNVTASRNQSPS